MSQAAVLKHKHAGEIDGRSINSGRSAGRPNLHSNRYGTSCSVRALVLFGGDLAAFFFSALLSAASGAIGDKSGAWLVAYDRLQEHGIAWRGWETLLVLAVLLSRLGGRGHYTQRVPFWTEFGDVLRCSGLALLFDFVLTTKIYAITFSTEAILRWVLFVPLVIVVRSLGRLVLSRVGLLSLRTIIVGDVEAARAAKAALSSDKSVGYDVVADVPLNLVAEASEAWCWHELVEAHRADFVVVALGGAETRQMKEILASLALARVPFAVMPTVGGLPVFGFDAHYFFSHDVMLLVNRNNLMRPLNQSMKRIFDCVVALLLLLAFLPTFALIALLTKRDGGPVFFRQERIGAFGRPFTCFKFRTMVVDADAVLCRLFEGAPEAAAEWAATQKLRKDPRVTPIGRFLRATSLDELPQLLNVLRGDMSLVGPRPIVAAEAARYGRSLPFYTEARPGLTGLWQVSGRSDTSYERRVELDVWYVKNWTLWHDIAILIKTLPAVLQRRGAV